MGKKHHLTDEEIPDPATEDSRSRALRCVRDRRRWFYFRKKIAKVFSAPSVSEGDAVMAWHALQAEVSFPSHVADSPSGDL